MWRWVPAGSRRFSVADSVPKLLILVRRDLGLSWAGMMEQAAHAAEMWICKGFTSVTGGDFFLSTAAIEMLWLMGERRKEVRQVAVEGDLLAIYGKVKKKATMRAYLVERHDIFRPKKGGACEWGCDATWQEVGHRPNCPGEARMFVTALALGPGLPEEIAEDIASRVRVIEVVEKHMKDKPQMRKLWGTSVGEWRVVLDEYRSKNEKLRKELLRAEERERVTS
jgi:peptidyl-tRNA hydrolase